MPTMAAAASKAGPVRVIVWLIVLQVRTLWLLLLSSECVQAPAVVFYWRDVVRMVTVCGIVTMRPTRICLYSFTHEVYYIRKGNIS